MAIARALRTFIGIVDLRFVTRPRQTAVAGKRDRLERNRLRSLSRMPAIRSLKR